MTANRSTGTKTYRDYGPTSIYADERVWDDVVDFDRLMQAMYARIDSLDARVVLGGFITGLSLEATVMGDAAGADAASGVANALRWLEHELVQEPVDRPPATKDELARLRARHRERADREE